MLQQSLILEVQIQKFLSQVPHKSIVIAYSGGLDSMVLLHLLSRFVKDKSRLEAIYINHGLQLSADDWDIFCQKTALSLNISYQSISVKVIETQRKGIEAVAREKRYQALFNAMKSKDVLVTGHYLKDQAETTLMALIRGSGVAGLAGMPFVKYISKNNKQIQHYRPLLFSSESSLKKYATTHQLDWVEDPSNLSLSFKRNFVRHKVLPVLEQAWPAPIQNIAKSATIMSESLSLMNDLAEIDLQGVLVNKNCVSMVNAKQLPWSRQKNIMRYWFNNFLPIKLTSTILNWVETCLENENPEALPVLKLSKNKLRYYNKTFYYLFDNKDKYSVNVSEFDFIELGFSSKIFEEVDLGKAKEFLSKAVVRNIHQDDEVNFKNLKKWFKHKKIPPWDRNRWPVIELNGEVVVVFGFWKTPRML